MDEIARIVVESQALETLTKLRRIVASDMTIKFEETYEPLTDSDIPYHGEALVELFGAYVKDSTIALLAWVKHWNFHERALEKFWNLLSQSIYEELTNKIPELKWSSLEIHFLDSMEDLEKAAFLSQAFP